jgi:hypothetical protein
LDSYISFNINSTGQTVEKYIEMSRTSAGMTMQILMENLWTNPQVFLKKFLRPKKGYISETVRPGRKISVFLEPPCTPHETIPKDSGQP